MEGVNPSSLLVWFPAVQGCGIPHPKTEIVELGAEMLWGILDGKPLDLPQKTALYDAAQRIGYPLFLRTDLTSGKHQWRDTCYVEGREDLLPHIGALAMDEAGHMMMGLPSRVVVLRRYIPLEATFTAFEGMPVARERRYFVSGGKVVCHHPYWPESAIEEGWSQEPLPQDWRDLLAALNEESQDEVARLTVYAEGVGAALGGAWSVDFARSKAGQWLLIDMAIAAESWHEDSCAEKAAFAIPDPWIAAMAGEGGLND